MRILERGTAVFVVVAFLAACGGRTANPVMVSQYNDTKKSCGALEYEIRFTENEIQRLVGKTDNTGKNIALGVAGWFFLVPWFFMDFKNAEAQEYEAYRQRYNHLSSLAIDKGCNLETTDLPSVHQMKEEYEAQQGSNDDSSAISPDNRRR